MLVKSITLKAGSSSRQPPLVLTNPQFTVLIGPNNSGKSLFIKELHQHLSKGGGHETHVIKNIEFATPISGTLNKLKTSPEIGQKTNTHWSWYEIGGEKFQYPTIQMQNAFSEPNKTENTAVFAGYYSIKKTLNLTGENRLKLIKPQSQGDLKNPKTSLSKLFINDKRRLKLRETIAEAFGLHIGLDLSNGGQISMNFGESPPPKNERSLEENVLNWHKNAKASNTVSDGVRAFTGILHEILSGDPSTLLIDEPEAFLHPALAFRLGKEIANSAIAGQKQVFAATHSPQFLFGAIQSGISVNIVRLTHTKSEATARLLPSDVISTLMKDPLLRSANVLSGLFHESVIVTEADADRAFYQEINERLLNEKDSRGIENPFFINANGKSTLHRIVAPLRALGVPTVSIADIDVLNEGGKSWTNHLKAYGLPTPQHQPLGTQRLDVWKNLENKGQPKLNGINKLGSAEQEAAENLLEQLTQYGFFIVPVGEVERWLKKLKVSRAKHNWLHEIFDAMGNDPENNTYQKPDNDPVWDFIGEIKKWLANPKRKGIKK